MDSAKPYVSDRGKCKSGIPVKQIHVVSQLLNTVSPVSTLKTEKERIFQVVATLCQPTLLHLKEKALCFFFHVMRE